MLITSFRGMDQVSHQSGLPLNALPSVTRDAVTQPPMVGVQRLTAPPVSSRVIRTTSVMPLTVTMYSNPDGSPSVSMPTPQPNWLNGALPPLTVGSSSTRSRKNR